MLQESIKITSEVFFDIFPFTIVFNRGMRVRNLGLGLLRLIPRIVGKKVNHEFILLRPLLNFTWEEILLHTNNVFEIMSVDPIIRDGQVRYSTGDLHEGTGNKN